MTGGLRWLIEDEAFSEAAYTATAVGFFPDKPLEQVMVSTRHARSILAYILKQISPPT